MIRTDGILFDLDGTLWDATASLVYVWHEALKDEPDIARTPSREELKEVMGMDGPQLMHHLFPALSAQRGAQLFEQVCQVEDVYLREHGGQVYPTLHETLGELSDHVSLGIVSNCGPNYIPTFFAATGFETYFSGWECVGRTGRPKSENIRTLSERLELRHPLYIGDTMMDLEAARSANVNFIHAAYGFGTVPPGIPAISRPEELFDILEFA